MSSTTASLGKWTLNETKRVAVFRLKLNLSKIGDISGFFFRNRLNGNGNGYRKLALFNSVKNSVNSVNRETQAPKIRAQESPGSQDSEPCDIWPSP